MHCDGKTDAIVYSYESGVLEDPAAVPPAGIFQMTTDPEKAPDAPQRLTVTFCHGGLCIITLIIITINIINHY